MWSRKTVREEGAPREDATPGAAGQDATQKTSRRLFLGRLGLGAILAALAGQAYVFLRSLFPNLLYERPDRFKIGPPDQFSEGARFFENERVFVLRERNTFHAISAVCTHLGCTVKMERVNQLKKVQAGGREFEEQFEFRCPCHGSKYFGDGTNYSGPAPKPLAHYRLEVSPDDGQLVVDRSQIADQDFRLTV
jgi:menaquinol-cytochrome c reductase iron-sulfur subunit